MKLNFTQLMQIEMTPITQVMMKMVLGLWTHSQLACLEMIYHSFLLIVGLQKFVIYQITMILTAGVLECMQLYLNNAKMTKVSVRQQISFVYLLIDQ